MAVASFPQLKPSSRSWTPGSQPTASFGTLSGYESRVLLGSKPVGTALSVGFENLLEDKFLLITAHYLVAKGSYETFSLPASVFAGMNDFGSVTPPGFTWRYASAPSVNWVAPGIGNVSVSFLAVSN